MSALIVILLFTIGCNPSARDAQLQEQCAGQCKEYFGKAYGDNVFDDWEHSGSVFYKCHHHKMNQCFIMLDESGYKRSDDKLYKMKSLWNLSEKKRYGYFYHIGSSMVCDVRGKRCKSESEWDALVKPYMKD